MDDTESVDISFQNLVIQAKELMQRNLKEGEGYTYICPDIKRYPHQWLWDSCYHIIVNSHLDIDLAKKEFETLVKKQDSEGHISHMNYWEHKFSPIDFVVKRYYKNRDVSSLTQTPVIPQALRAIYEKTKDDHFLSYNLNKVKTYYDLLYSTRVFNDDEVPLLNIIHTWESGTDNCPIYDAALGINHKSRFLPGKWLRSLLRQLKVLKQNDWDMHRIRESDFFLYKDLLFNCVYIQGCRDLAYLYDQLGNNKESAELKERAKSLEDVLITSCWNPEDEIFYGLYGKENKMDTVKSAHSLLPLMLDGLPHGKAVSLVEEHLLNPKEFWSDYPVPTVALNEPSYSEKAILLWRGPTWICLNWFIIKGLKKHNFENVATDLAQRTIEMIHKSGYREFYSPTTGQGMGAKNFGWSTLVIDIEKSIFNLDLDFLLLQEFRHIKRMDL